MKRKAYAYMDHTTRLYEGGYIATLTNGKIADGCDLYTLFDNDLSFNNLATGEQHVVNLNGTYFYYGKAKRKGVWSKELSQADGTFPSGEIKIQLDLDQEYTDDVQIVFGDTVPPRVRINGVYYNTSGRISTFKNALKNSDTPVFAFPNMSQQNQYLKIIEISIGKRVYFDTDKIASIKTHKSIDLLSNSMPIGTLEIDLIDTDMSNYVLNATGGIISSIAENTPIVAVLEESNAYGVTTEYKSIPHYFKSAASADECNSTIVAEDVLTLWQNIYYNNSLYYQPKEYLGRTVPHVTHEQLYNDMLAVLGFGESWNWGISSNINGFLNPQNIVECLRDFFIYHKKKAYINREHYYGDYPARNDAILTLDSASNTHEITLEYTLGIPQTAVIEDVYKGVTVDYYVGHGNPQAESIDYPSSITYTTTVPPIGTNAPVTVDKTNDLNYCFYPVKFQADIYNDNGTIMYTLYSDTSPTWFTGKTIEINFFDFNFVNQDDNFTGKKVIITAIGGTMGLIYPTPKIIDRDTMRGSPIQYFTYDLSDYYNYQLYPISVKLTLYNTTTNVYVEYYSTRDTSNIYNVDVSKINEITFTVELPLDYVEMPIMIEIIHKPEIEKNKKSAFYGDKNNAVNIDCLKWLSAHDGTDAATYTAIAKHWYDMSNKYKYETTLTTDQIVELDYKINFETAVEGTYSSMLVTDIETDWTGGFISTVKGLGDGTTYTGGTT